MGRTIPLLYVIAMFAVLKYFTSAGTIIQCPRLPCVGMLSDAGTCGSVPVKSMTMSEPETVSASSMRMVPTPNCSPPCSHGSGRCHLGCSR